MPSYHLETQCNSRNLILEITEDRIAKLATTDMTKEILKIIKLLRWWLKSMTALDLSSSMQILYQQSIKDNIQHIKQGFNKLIILCSQNEKLKIKSELHSETCYLLAICYAEGIGMERNIKKAIELFQTDTLKQHPYQSFHLKNLSYQKTIDEGDITQNMSNYYLQLLKNIPSTREEALRIYYLHAISFMRGHLPDCETTLEKNEVLAFQIFSALIRKGHIESIFNLGSCYRDGKGVVKDAKMAAHYYLSYLRTRPVISSRALGICDKLSNALFTGVEADGITKIDQDIKLATELSATLAQVQQHAMGPVYLPLQDNKDMKEAAAASVVAAKTVLINRFTQQSGSACTIDRNDYHKSNKENLPQTAAMVIKGSFASHKKL